MPVVVETIAGMREYCAARRAEAAAAGHPHPSLVLVPTMGALHDGHRALIDRARELGDIVVVSIFVNPLQFSAGEDLDRYPRTLEHDLEILTELGVDAVFAPPASEMYPAGPALTRVSAGDLGMRYEGRTRRGHFDGVLTVVAKLLNIVGPRLVVFGQKDAQQVFLVRRMVLDLDIDVLIEVVETVRDADGLALSSRNRFLDAEGRLAARALSRALEAAESAADRGTDAVVAAAQSVIMGDPAVDLEYLAVVDPATFLPAPENHHGRAVVLLAATVGDTRLLDNTVIRVG